jgi:hypothetical protein
MAGWAGQVERVYLVRAPAFEPAPRMDLREEGVGALRWWTLDDVDSADAIFAPRRLPALVNELLADGPPAQPVEADV